MSAPHLEPRHLIGKGLHRECYAHPCDEGKCVKIAYAGHHAETLREQRYYRLLDERAASWNNLSRYYGETHTNLGRGTVFQLIRDEDGAVSKTLQQYLTLPTGGGGIIINELIHAVQELCDYMFDQRIITMTLKAKNICYQRRAPRPRLVLVDSLGNSDFIPLCSHVGYLAHIKIRRRWRRFAADIFHACQHNPPLHDTLRDGLRDAFARRGFC